MYTTAEVLAATTPTVATAIILPNTGADESIVMLALAVIASLSVWALVYKKSNSN